MTNFNLPGLPAECEWKNPPLDWKVRPDDSLEILAGEHTDWFIDPAGDFHADNAPCAVFTPPDAHFLVRTRLKVDFDSIFDAGSIQLRENDGLWAKLCFEYSPQRQPMIVSVVTRGVSDDCNSVVVNGNEVYLRVAVTPRTLGFHYSLDGSYWHFVRYFSLGAVKNLRVGFSAQSPTGKLCRVVFSDISYREGRIADYRSGE